MKRELPLRSNALALALALSFAIGAPQAGHADVKSLMNPMNWLSGDPNEKAAQKAAKKALEAQEAANRAMAEAQKAQEQATEARRQAEALQNGQSDASTKKPVVVAPAAKQTEESANTAETTSTEETSAQHDAATKTQRIYQEASTQSAPSAEPSSEQEEAFTTTSTRQEPWNPLSWFRKPGGEAPSAPEETNQVSDEQHQKETFSLTRQSEPSETSPQQAAPEKAAPEKASIEESAPEQKTGESESKGSFWNPMRLIAKPQSQANNEPTAETEQQQPAVSPEAALKTKAALLETEKGNIAFELFPDQAPQTVMNFAKLVNEGFYNRYNMKFHRVVPGFVIQTGDPTGTGAGGSKQHVPLEAKNKLSHNAKGVVAMARGADPNSATSQFYITLAPQTSLDGKYAVFGKVISGLDVLDKIEKDDMLYGIKLVDINAITRDAGPEKKHFFSSMF